MYAFGSIISLCLAWKEQKEFENEERKSWIQSSDICMTVLTHGNIWEIKPTFFPLVTTPGSYLPLHSSLLFFFFIIYLVFIDFRRMNEAQEIKRQTWTEIWDNLRDVVVKKPTRNYFIYYKYLIYQQAWQQTKRDKKRIYTFDKVIIKMLGGFKLFSCTAFYDVF